jgi:asparagine synthase (glutamine-hydrolysing)
MCGIFGVISREKNKISPGQLRALTDMMIKRGPDGYGEYINDFVALSMRRLSIIDLSHGWQPFYSADSRYVVFQNGEIYNYLALREKLQSLGYEFKTNSDTEVLAHGFHCWQETLFEKLDGMFAISIFDTLTKKIFLARDKFGEKPLYYSFNSKNFSFSSTTLNLTAQSWIGPSLSPEGLFNYFAVGFVPGQHTLFKNISKVLPGYYLELNTVNLTIREHQYYELGSKQGSKENISLDDLLPEIVNSRLMSEVPIGIFLSGGLDSSIIAALAKKYKSDIKTLSIGFKNKKYDEAKYAEEVAKHINSDHKTFYFNELDFLNLLPRVASNLDEPIADQALLPVFMLCEAAKEEVKVVLSGEGADELFAGYSYYKVNNNFPSSLRQKIKKIMMASLKFEVPHFLDENLLVTSSGFPLISDLSFRTSLLSKINNSDTGSGKTLSFRSSGLGILTSQQVSDLKTWLPDDLLVKLDRMTMCHSIEGRAPFLSSDLLSYILEIKKNNSVLMQDKKILRNYARSLLPSNILNRNKQGFVLPMEEWLKSWFKAVDLKRYGTSLNEYLDLNFLISFVKSEVSSNKMNQRLLFAVALLVLWHSQYLEICKKNTSIFENAA